MKIIKALMGLMLACAPAWATTIPITGTIKNPNGTAFNGTLRLTLSYSAARDTSNNNLIVAQRVEFPVRNGTLPTNAKIVPNSVLVPINTVYTAEYINPFGARIAQNVFYIAGLQFDIGTAIPTPLTTSNISFQTITGLDNMSTTNFAALNLTSENIFAHRINNIRYCDKALGANAGEKIIACISDLPATGGTADASGFEGGQAWLTCPFTGVTKNVTFILGGSVTTPNTDCAITDNIEVVMKAGALLSPPVGTTLTLHLSDASSLTHHFTGSGTVLLSGVDRIHTRWFDDNSHDQVAAQKAIDSVGDNGAGTITLRAGHEVRIDDVLTLTAPIVISQKSTTIDCGGITAFNNSLSVPLSPKVGGFIWNGAANVPMLEITGVIQGTTIQNCRFYGNTTNKPRAAISYVQKSGNPGQSLQNLKNLKIGEMGGDGGNASFSNLVDGVVIGDNYDSGVNGTNDIFNFENLEITGCTNAAINQTAQQGGLGSIRNSTLFGNLYGIKLAADFSLYNVFVAGNGVGASNTGADFYFVATDLYSNSVAPKLHAYNVQSELSSRLLKMDGNGIAEFYGGNWALGSNTAADKSVIYAVNNDTHVVKLNDFTFPDQAVVGPPKLTLQSNPGAGGINMLVFNETSDSNTTTIDIAPQNVFSPTWVCKTRPLSSLNVTNNVDQYPAYCNLVNGFQGTLDPARYDIPTKCTRMGDPQNRNGTMEYCVAGATLATTSGASVTSTGLIPANVLVYGVTSRTIDGGISCTGGCATIRIGTVAAPTKWATSVAQGGGFGDTTGITDFNLGVVAAPYFTQTAEDVVVSTNAGTLNGGSIRLTVAFMRLIAPPDYF